MGATYCTGRKVELDGLLLEQTQALSGFACGAPPYAGDPLHIRPYWQHESDRDLKELAAKYVLDEDDSVKENLEPLHLCIAALLAAYSSEVHDGHGLLTAADSYYFALLEFQRRHDSVGIQVSAVQQMLDNNELEATPCAWQALLAKKRAEAMEALAHRAQNYAVGRRSAQGLLQITSGAQAESTLRSYEALLDKEYDLAASEIQVTLAALNAEPETARRDHARALLIQLDRSAKFWTSQIEETFEVWQTASMRLNQAQVKRNGAWGELLPVVRTLLVELRNCKRRSATQNSSVDSMIASDVSITAAAAARTQCCVRLLELDLHQYAHGLSSAPRRQLLLDLFSSAREDAALPTVARALLHDSSFRALQNVQIGDSGHGVLDVESTSGHPWTTTLAEVFGELMYSVSETSPRDQVELLRAIEDFIVRQPGLHEVRKVATDYKQPRTGRTALHQAVRAGSSWLCQRLLEIQADPHACDAKGCTPLSMAENDAVANNDSQRAAALKELLSEAARRRQQKGARSGEHSQP